MVRTEVLAFVQRVNHSVCILFTTGSEYDYHEVMAHFSQELGEAWSLIEFDGEFLGARGGILDHKAVY